MTETKTTVAELIEKLKKLNPNKKVFIQHYNGGYDELMLEHIRKIDLNLSQEFSAGQGTYWNITRENTDIIETCYVLNYV